MYFDVRDWPLANKVFCDVLQDRPAAAQPQVLQLYKHVHVVASTTVQCSVLLVARLFFGRDFLVLFWAALYCAREVPFSRSDPLLRIQIESCFGCPVLEENGLRREIFISGCRRIPC